jgi:hypothetical protein
MRVTASHSPEGYSETDRRSSHEPERVHAISQDGCAPKKRLNSASAPLNPTATPPSGEGVQEGPNRTAKPAFQRSRARACTTPDGAASGCATRTTRVSRTASESAAVAVRDRSTVSRASPRSRRVRASTSPRSSRRASPGASVSTTEHRTRPGSVGSVGPGGASSARSQRSVAPNSATPAVRVATVPAGSPVGRTRVRSPAARARDGIPPASLSGRPAPRARRAPARPPRWPSRSGHWRRRSRGRAGAGAGGGS